MVEEAVLLEDFVGFFGLSFFSGFLAFSFFGVSGAAYFVKNVDNSANLEPPSRLRKVTRYCNSDTTYLCMRLRFPLFLWEAPK